MKFVCRKCEMFMLFQKVENPAAESVGVTFACPSCGSRISMVTNPGETQLVHALGVKLGGRTEPVQPMELTRETLKESAGPRAAGGTQAVAGTADAGGGSCPFTEMINQAKQAEPALAGGQEPGMPWTPEAAQRLANIPDFIRPMAKKEIERLAREQGATSVTVAVMDASKKQFMGMSYPTS